MSALWKGITLSPAGTTTTVDSIQTTASQIAAALSSGSCPFELSSTLHALLTLGMLANVEGHATSHTVDLLVASIGTSYPESTPKEPLWQFLTELSKVQLVQSQSAAPIDLPLTAPMDLMAEALGVDAPDVSLPLTSTTLEPTSTVIGSALFGEQHPVGSTWSQRLSAHFRPRRVVRVYKSYSIAVSIANSNSKLVDDFSKVLDGFTTESIAALRASVCKEHPVHPVAFFWAGLVACLTAPTLAYPKGAPRDLLELYDVVYGGDSRAPGVVTSLMTSLSLVLYSLLGTSINDLLVMEKAVVPTRAFSQYVPVDQLDTAASPSNPALCRMVVKLVESLFNNRILFANPEEQGFVPMLSPTIAYSVFVDLHCRLDEVVIANRQYRPTQKEVICREYTIDSSVLITALKTPAAAFNSITADHIGMSVGVLAEMTEQTALYAKETKVESLHPGTQKAATSAPNFDIPPPLPSGERFFKLAHGVPEPSWGEYFSDRFPCNDVSGRAISACGIFIKTAPLLFLTELLYRGMWDWASRLVQGSMDGSGLGHSPLNMFLFPHRSLTQLSTAHLSLQLSSQSTPAARAETIHHSFITAMVSNMHLDTATSQQVDWAPSTFVYSLQAQLVNMFERDVSNPVVKGLVKPLQQGTVVDAAAHVSDVLAKSLSTLLKMIPLLRVCQSYFSAYHFPVISRVMSFLATMVRVEGVRNREVFSAGGEASWKWCSAASEAYVAFIAPSIRCTCAVSPSVALFDVLEELLDALSYPVAPIDDSVARLSASASQVRLHARVLIGALDLPKTTIVAGRWAAFPLPKFVDCDLLCAPYDVSAEGPGRRYPHDAVQTKEITGILNQSMRRVTSDNVHQYTLTLRKVLFSDPILFVRKLISLAIGNEDIDLIFCQAQLLQGAPKAILRMFVVLAIDAMESHAEEERKKADQRVGLIGALIAFVWAQNSHNFQECGRLLLRTVADILQREAKSSATFAVELLRSLLLHMLHEPLESEEQYNAQQLVALAALPTSRWFAQNGADSFLQNKWFDPQTMLLNMKQTNRDSTAQADEAMAFSYMSSVNSSKSNLGASNQSQFSFRNFIFAASFTPLTLEQCRLGFCEALGSALDPCVRDVSVGAVILQRLAVWHARTYDWYCDLSGTVEDVMMVSARHTSCFLDLTLSLVQLACVGNQAGALTELPVVQLDLLKDGLPQLAARCRLVLQEFGVVAPVATDSLNDMFWQLSSPDASFPRSAYYFALQQVHRFLRQAITGKAGSPPTSKNEDKGLTIEEVAAIEEEALKDYLKEMAEDEAKRRRQHFKDQLSARAPEDKIEVGEDNSDDEESTGKEGGTTVKGMIMEASWLRIEQKVIARYLLDARDAVVREAISHSGRGTNALTVLSNKIAVEVLGGGGDMDRIVSFCHETLVPRVLLSSADGVVVGLVLKQLWAGLQSSIASDASPTVARLQREAIAARLMSLLNAFITELVVFIPSLTDAEAKRAGLALQRVLTLCKEVSSVAAPSSSAVGNLGMLTTLLGKDAQTTSSSDLPLPLEAFLTQSFSQLLRECDMSNQTSNAAQGSGYSLIVRNAFVVLDRIKVSLLENPSAKAEPLFPTTQPHLSALSESVRLHANPSSASYAAASALAAMYESRIKVGGKRPRSGEVVDAWVSQQQ